MATTKKCAICDVEWIVSRLDKQDPYVCQACTKWMKTRRGKTVRRNKEKRR